MLRPPDVAAIGALGEAARAASAPKRPIHKLSVNLLKTYKGINELYFEAKRRRKEDKERGIYNGGADDKNGYYLTKKETIRDRYQLSDTKLGAGSFGTVAHARDVQTSSDVAVKFIRSPRQFARLADTELHILRAIQRAESDGKSLCVKLLDTFMHKNHRVFVFERLSYSLYDLMRHSNFTGCLFPSPDASRDKSCIR